MLFKTEVKSHSGGHEESKGVLSTYLLLWRIVKLPSVLEYVFVLLTTAVSLMIKINKIILNEVDDVLPL